MQFFQDIVNLVTGQPLFFRCNRCDVWKGLYKGISTIDAEFSPTGVQVPGTFDVLGSVGRATVSQTLRPELRVISEPISALNSTSSVCMMTSTCFLI